MLGVVTAGDKNIA